VLADHAMQRTGDEDRRTTGLMRYARLSARVDVAKRPCRVQDARASIAVSGVVRRQLAQVPTSQHHGVVAALASDHDFLERNQSYVMNDAGPAFTTETLRVRLVQQGGRPTQAQHQRHAVNGHGAVPAIRAEM